MALIKYSVTLVAKQDAPFNVLPDTDVSIRKVSDGNLVQIYSDAAGLIPIAQPGAKTDSRGVFEFYTDSVPVVKAEWSDGVNSYSEIFNGNSLQALSGLTEPSDLARRHRLETTVAEIATGVFSVGDRLSVIDRDHAPFDIVSGGTPDGFGTLDAGNGNTAELLVNGKANVKMYGAGAGALDDGPACQAAVDANGSVAWPDGEYLYQTGINLKGNLTLDFSTGAIIRPRASNFSIFKYTDTTVISNLVINSPFASDFGGSRTGVTLIELKNLATGCEIHSPRATSIERMVHVTDNSYGLKIYSPSSFLVPKPIETGITVGTVDVYSPNLDNGLPIGGSGIGTGVKFGGSGITHGGYIQGFDDCIEWNGRGASLGTYVESANNSGFFFNGAFGVTVIGNFWFGFSGNSMFKGRNSESIKVINPTATINNATTGVFDFDDTNKGCTYDMVRRQDGLANQTLGITTGIQPANSQNDGFKGLTTKKATIAVGSPSEMFKILVKENSATRVEIQTEAIETTGFFGSISRKSIFLIRRSAATTTISGVSTVTGFNLDNANSAYTLDAVVSAAETPADSNTVTVSLTISSTGTVTPALANVRCRIEAETSADIVDTWAV